MNLEQQFANAGVSDLFGTKKEVAALPDILTANEVVQYATSGLVESNTVLMVLTNERVLFIDKGLLYGIRSTEIPLNMINSVNYSIGLVLGSISIVNGATKTEVKQVVKTTAPIMVDKIKAARDAFMQPQAAPVAPVQNTDTDVEQIRKFKSLLDEGILTQEEFEAKKKLILGI